MKTIKIEIENYDGSRVWHQDLKDWAGSHLANSERDGQIEGLEEKAENLARVCGFLLARLVHTGQLSVEDFTKLVAPHAWPPPRFVEVEEIPSESSLWDLPKNPCCDACGDPATLTQIGEHRRLLRCGKCVGTLRDQWGEIPS